MCGKGWVRINKVKCDRGDRLPYLQDGKHVHYRIVFKYCNTRLAWEPGTINSSRRAVRTLSCKEMKGSVVLVLCVWRGGGNGCELT